MLYVEFIFFESLALFQGEVRVTIVLKSYFPAELNIQDAFNKLSVVGERRLGDDILMEGISMISRMCDVFSSYQ